MAKHGGGGGQTGLQLPEVQMGYLEKFWVGCRGMGHKPRTGRSRAGVECSAHLLPCGSGGQDV